MMGCVSSGHLPSLPEPTSTNLNPIDSNSISDVVRDPITNDNKIDLRERQLAAAILIQSLWRMYLAKKYIKAKFKSLKIIQSVIRIALAKFAAKRLRANQKLRRIENCENVGILTLKYAVGLRAADLNGFSDPYAYVHREIVNVHYDSGVSSYEFLNFTGSCFKSNIIFKTINPVWNENCFLTNLNANSSIVITVLDKDEITSDEFLGQVCVYLRDHPQLFDCEEVDFRALPLKPLLVRPRDDLCRHIPFDIPSSLSTTPSSSTASITAPSSRSSSFTLPSPSFSGRSLSLPIPILSSPAPLATPRGNLSFSLRLLPPQRAYAGWAMKYSRLKRMQNLMGHASDYKRRFVLASPEGLRYFDDDKNLHQPRATFECSAVTTLSRAKDSKGEEGFFVGTATEGWLLQWLQDRGDGQKNFEKNLIRASNEKVLNWELCLKTICPQATNNIQSHKLFSSWGLSLPD